MSLHSGRPVRAGVRPASFCRIQSVIREGAGRTLLFELDAAIQRPSPGRADHPSAVPLTGVHHNLLRRWAEW